MTEYADHLHEHMVQRLVVEDGRYRAPLGPGLGVELEPASLARYRSPTATTGGAAVTVCASPWSAGRCTTGSTTSSATTWRSSCTPTTRRSTARSPSCWPRASGSTSSPPTASTRPSQAEWLHPLDDLVDPSAVSALAPRAVELCRFDGALLCVPRNIDVRVLWWRTDLLGAAPATWDDVEAAPGAFGFTGRESGLFGLFYELDRRRRRGRCSTPTRRPTLTGAAADRRGRAACSAWPRRRPTTCRAGTTTRSTTPCSTGGSRWRRRGPVATTGIRRSDRYRAPGAGALPGGRSYSRRATAGPSPTTCGDVPAAVALLERLASPEAGQAEAAAGGIPAHLGRAGRRTSRSTTPTPRASPITATRSRTPCSPTRRSCGSPRSRTPGGEPSTTRCVGALHARRGRRRHAVRSRGGPR